MLQITAHALSLERNPQRVLQHPGVMLGPLREFVCVVREFGGEGGVWSGVVEEEDLSSRQHILLPPHIAAL